MATDTETRNQEIRSQNAPACPVVTAVEQVGTPWRLNVLYALQQGEKRFNELKRATGARSKTLSDALDVLVEHDLVDRRMEEAAPIAVYYDLTDKSRALSAVLSDLGDWATEWVEDVPDDHGTRPRIR
jgi:DNA-binding HxlR family transcriptional regulator